MKVMIPGCGSRMQLLTNPSRIRISTSISTPILPKSLSFSQNRSFSQIEFNRRCLNSNSNSNSAFVVSRQTKQNLFNSNRSRSRGNAYAYSTQSDKPNPSQPQPPPPAPSFPNPPKSDPELTSDREKAKDRAAVGPFNLRAGLLFLITGVGLLYYFRQEKASVAARRASENQDAKVGRPRIGGPFELLYPTKDPKTGKIHGRKVNEKDLLGSFSLVYFGFTNCPDICPEELDKMGEVVDMIAKEHGPVINPIFVSCDPARDTLSAVWTYISDFHPSMIGLTGSFESIKSACKAYRVYFSTPPSADPNSDYLVDHSIFFYLMDPEGRFVDAFGRALDKDEVFAKVDKFVKMWKEGGNQIEKAELKKRIENQEERKVES